MKQSDVTHITLAFCQCSSQVSPSFYLLVNNPSHDANVVTLCAAWSVCCICLLILFHNLKGLVLCVLTCARSTTMLWCKKTVTTAGEMCSSLIFVLQKRYQRCWLIGLLTLSCLCLKCITFTVLRSREPLLRACICCWIHASPDQGGFPHIHTHLLLDTCLA